MTEATRLVDVKSNDDFFVIPDLNDTYIIYAPLRRIVMKVNQAGLTAIANIVTGRGFQGNTSIEIEDVRNQIQQSGLLDDIPFDLIPQMRPTHTYKGMILSLTSKCNLRCIYCYANGGETLKTMPWEIAKAALDQMIPMIGKKNNNSFWLTFHGGGEALVEKPLLFRCVKHAKFLAKEEGISLRCGITTNATLIDEEFADWMIDNIQIATLSIDGLENHQNFQRPTAGGGDSFNKAIQGAKYLRERGVRFSLRATITPYNLPYLEDIAEFFATEVLGDLGTIHFEPVEQVGRGALWGDESRMTAEDFVREYKKAIIKADTYGIKLSTSGDRLRRKASTTFCGAQGDGLKCITPEGFISACTRVTLSQEELSKKFFFGNYVNETGKFSFWEEEYKGLRDMQMQFLPQCAQCFCKWHCSGHCSASREVGEGDFNCEVARTLSAWRLSEIVESNNTIYAIPVEEESNS